MYYYGNFNLEGGIEMPTLENVTAEKSRITDFCLTDCGPSEGCNPDDD